MQRGSLEGRGGFAAVAEDRIAAMDSMAPLPEADPHALEPPVVAGLRARLLAPFRVVAGMCACWAPCPHDAHLTLGLSLPRASHRSRGPPASCWGHASLVVAACRLGELEREWGGREVEDGVHMWVPIPHAVHISKTTKQSDGQI